MGVRVKIVPYQLPSGKVIFFRPVAASERAINKITCTLILNWLEQCGWLPVSENFFSYLRRNNAIGQADILSSFLSSKGIGYPDLKALKNDQLKEILETLRDLDECPPEPDKGDAESFCLPSSGDSEADLIADLLSIFNNELAITLYRTFDVATIQNILKRMELQSKREELEKEWQGKQAVSRLHQYRKTGAFEKAQWKDSI
jgi:hypothetical protein